MQNGIKKYTKEKLINFSINIKQKKHITEIWKKDIDSPQWTQFNLKKNIF